MPPTILSSSLLSVPVLNTILNNPDLAPIDRIPLLHAKIALLENGAPTSSSASGPTQATRTKSASAQSLRASESVTDAERSGTGTTGPVEDDLKRLREEMEARIEVAGLFMGLKPAKVVEAENELTLVESRLKGLFKAQARRPTEDAHAASATGTGKAATTGTSGTMNELRGLRIRALKDLVEVEEALGREGRVKRWRELISKLQEEPA